MCFCSAAFHISVRDRWDGSSRTAPSESRSEGTCLLSHTLAPRWQPPRGPPPSGGSFSLSTSIGSCHSCFSSLGLPLFQNGHSHGSKSNFECQVSIKREQSYEQKLCERLHRDRLGMDPKPECRRRAHVHQQVSLASQSSSE